MKSTRNLDSTPNISSLSVRKWSSFEGTSAAYCTEFIRPAIFSLQLAAIIPTISTSSAKVKPYVLTEDLVRCRMIMKIYLQNEKQSGKGGGEGRLPQIFTAGRRRIFCRPIHARNFRRDWNDTVFRLIFYEMGLDSSTHLLIGLGRVSRFTNETIKIIFLVDFDKNQ